jgi:hypothetical protein
VIRAGVIRNLRSHRNHGAGPGGLPDGVLAMEPEEPSELFAGLRRFAEAGIDLVVVDGGDGTVREVLTRLPEAYGGRIPRLGVLPNGKTNALALDIGVPLGSRLEQLLKSAEAGGPLKRRACLEIVRPGQAVPERRGFLFGMGAFVRGTELAQKSHGLGLFDNAAVALTLAAAAARTLAGGATDPWRRGEAAELSFAEGRRRWFLVLASTLKRLPLGLKPFGEPREGLKILSMDAPPRRLFRALPALLAGKAPGWLADVGCRRHDLPDFQAAFSGDFVLDGEIYAGGELSVRQGPELEFVIP